MLGLYSLGFLLIQVIRILASNNTAQKKVVQILMLTPVLIYIAMEMKIVNPLTKFVMANIKTTIGG
jgi:hypothetical protein